MEKQQQRRRPFWLEVKKKQKTKTDEHAKTKQKLTDCNRMVTVDTVKMRMSWKNAELAKYTPNYWLTYGRSGKHATNLKCLPCYCCLCR